MKSTLSKGFLKIRKAFAFTGASALIFGAGLSHAGDLTILHINDHHSHLKPDSRMSLNLGGKSTRVRSGGMPAVVAKMKELEASKANVLKLHAGDAVSGSLFFTLFKGEADAALMNEVCFDAFALGNHEFNEGDAGLAKFLDFLDAGECNTPVLAANIKPEVGVSALTPNSETDYIHPYTIIDVAGMKVGIIGIDIVRKTIMSSSPDDTTRFLDEAETSQKMVNELKEAGIKYYYFEMVRFDELNEMYNMLNLYVVSSRVEGGPQAILECGLSKTPIISTDVGIASQILSKESIYEFETYNNPIPNINTAYKNSKKYIIPNWFDEYQKLFNETL